ncbi:hypothetical protein [Idiomarina abyssalis]|uniref:Uncharacterized protein n=1 Tax=Idiomarina abyssalis TaxID=86102 RepID=A0A8I1GB78_9GAMM|nr:hypothetical protein [Idiomarina abyssalis]MBJ7265476.1 hypothetical protein [Idiomarina abyssalis]MBJ7316850.1 hypothetical protein [Idiomarina abyssalis]
MSVKDVSSEARNRQGNPHLKRNSNSADNDARRIMSTIKIFSPLVRAAATSADKLARDGSQREMTAEDIVFAVKELWLNTYSLTVHMRDEMQSIKPDFDFSKSRHVFRKMLAASAERVAAMQIRFGRVDLDVLKAGASTKLSIGMGKPSAAVDSDIVEQSMKALKADKDLNNAFEADDVYVELENEMAVYLSLLESRTVFNGLAKAFSFWQPASKHTEIVNQLVELNEQQAAQFYKLSLGTNEQGLFDAENAQKVTNSSCQQLMLASIRESRNAIVQSYESCVQNLRELVHATDSPEERKALKIEAQRDGIPFDVIKRKTNTIMTVSYQCSKSAVSKLTALMDAPVTPDNTPEKKKEENASSTKEEQPIFNTDNRPE